MYLFGKEVSVNLIFLKKNKRNTILNIASEPRTAVTTAGTRSFFRPPPNVVKSAPPKLRSVGDGRSHSKQLKLSRSRACIATAENSPICCARWGPRPSTRTSTTTSSRSRTWSWTPWTMSRPEGSWTGEPSCTCSRRLRPHKFSIFWWFSFGISCSGQCTRSETSELRQIRKQMLWFLEGVRVCIRRKGKCFPKTERKKE